MGSKVKAKSGANKGGKKASKVEKKVVSPEPELESGSASEDEESEEEEQQLNINALEESDGDDDEDDEDDEEFIEARESLDSDEDDDDDDDEEEADEDEEDVPLSEAEFDDDADVVPHTKLTINNTVALREALARIELPWTELSFNEGQFITYHTKAEEDITDIYDDTQRELQFFKQGLDAAHEGRKKLFALNIPFSRPMDYFAEMVKTDEHMDKLKSKLVQEASEKKAREDSRKQRKLKKFGKQVQHETLQQRQKDKRETLDKIKSLKKKRKNNEIGGDDFDIAVEEAAFKPEEKQRNKKQKIQQRASQKSGPKKRPGKNRRRNKRK